MSIIYQRASRVLVWLGHKEDEVVRAGLNDICRYVCVEQPPKPQHKQVSYLWRDRQVTTFGEEDSLDPACLVGDALRSIGSSAWFGRGWVIQEVVLCTSACVYWGHAEIDFAWIGVAAYTGISQGHVNFSNEECIPIRHIMFMYLMYGRRYRSGRVVSFFTLLLNTTGFTFSDARDRVYGLLGLRTLECDPADGLPLVDPDYGITTMECYRRVTAKLLVEQKDLRVLSWTSHGANLKDDWPSWVPIWNKKTVPMFAEPSDGYKGITPPAGISTETYCDQERINITGFRVDTVKSGILQYFELTGKTDDCEELERIQALLRVLEHYHSLEALACTFVSAQRGKALEDIHVTALLSDYNVFMQWEPASSDAAQIPPDAAAARFLHRLLHDRIGHALFLTHSGMLGLGPEGMRVDDVVVVLHGASVPFVLRPAKDGLWRLIGECYVYDVNQGRIVREWEEKGSMSERFCIY
jgi:hypothetical protein